MQQIVLQEAASLNQAAISALESSERLNQGVLESSVSALDYTLAADRSSRGRSLDSSCYTKPSKYVLRTS